jgi:hypothetical protein
MCGFLICECADEKRNISTLPYFANSFKIRTFAPLNLHICTSKHLHIHNGPVVQRIE